MKDIKSVITKEEIKRLERAAKDKNKTKLADWAKQLEYQMCQEYDKWYKDQLGESIDNFILTIVYCLRFSSLTNFGSKRIESFMEDLFETIDMFRRGEANPEDYKKQLREYGINVKRRNDD